MNVKKFLYGGLSPNYFENGLAAIAQHFVFDLNHGVEISAIMRRQGHCGAGFIGELCFNDVGHIADFRRLTIHRDSIAFIHIDLNGVGRLACVVTFVRDGEIETSLVQKRRGHDKEN